MSELDSQAVLVIGAGIMGAGIAQIAAQAGNPVFLYDANVEASTAALEKLAATFEKLVQKGKISPSSAAKALGHITPISTLDQAHEVKLVVEAIVEKLEIKRSVFQELEGIVSEECILATNTSSISVTAIANGLKSPGRLVGMHFFNPVPLMKLVEVVTGLQTNKVVAQAVFALAKTWGKVPVYAKSTPGFIVNRIARPFYAETLSILQEQAASPMVIDACLKAAGFRMGPCELMDLIGHDTNFSVTCSVYEANFYDKRFVPSLVQQELVDGGFLGRKSGQGFYDYRDGAMNPKLASVSANSPFEAENLELHGKGLAVDNLIQRLNRVGIAFTAVHGSEWTGLLIDGFKLCLTNGVPATELGKQVAVFDLPLSHAEDAPLAWSISQGADALWEDKVERCLVTLQFNPQRISDVPGLVVARTIAMLINEAADAVHQGACDAEGADAAMKKGVNYPAGPFEWLAQWSAGEVVHVLDKLDFYYRGERYRVSPLLRNKFAEERNQ